MGLNKWIYDLKPEEFEKFVASLLPMAGFSDVRLVCGHEDKGFDILAKKDGEIVAIQVKHRKILSPVEIEKFIGHCLTNDFLPRKVMFVTSAQITPELLAVLQKVPPNFKFQLLGLNDLQELIYKSHLDDKYSNIAQLRKKSFRWLFSISILGSLASIIAVLLSSFLQFNKPSEPLDKQIMIVESALQNIHTLQTGLATLKEDMIAKEKATQEINEKYAKAKELEKLTDTQLEALKSALQAEKWWRTSLQYGLGFILGVSSSFVASILYAKWKQKKALSPEL